MKSEQEIAEQLFFQIQKEEDFKGCPPHHIIEVTLRTFEVNERGDRYVAACPSRITSTIRDTPNIQQQMKETACVMLRQLIHEIEDGRIVKL